MTQNLSYAGGEASEFEVKKGKRLSLMVVAALVAVTAGGLISCGKKSDPVIKVTGCHTVAVDGAGLDIPEGVGASEVEINKGSGNNSYRVEVTYDRKKCIATARATRKE
jgi:hypothetical protein